MQIALPGQTTPAAGFEVPLEMLAACHGRVQAQTETLQRLLPHLAAHGADQAAREAAAAVLRYFDSAARDHHADEEQDLFPALIESMAGSDAVCLHALTRSLTAEHRQLESLWQPLRAALAAVAAGDGAALAPALVQDFSALYASHIAREEAELLPQAGRLLDDATLDRVGLAMRQRRGLHAPP